MTDGTQDKAHRIGGWVYTSRSFPQLGYPNIDPKALCSILVVTGTPQKEYP